MNGYLLKALPDFRNVIENYAVHPWRGSRTQGRSLSLDEDIRHHFGRLEIALADIVEAAPLLARLGFLPEEPTLDAWFQGVELSRESPSYPLVPPEWFRGEPREVASEYLRLDRVTREYRQVRQQMPEFAEESVLGIDQSETASFPLVIDERGTALIPHDGTTLTATRDHLQAVVDSLRVLSSHLRSTDDALSRMMGILNLKPRLIAARRLGKVGELLKIAGRFDRMLSSWLDPQRRDEVRKYLKLCQDDLPEFREPGAFGLEPGVVQQFVDSLEVGSTILKPRGTTARTLLEHLDQAILSVGAMDRHLAEDQESLRDVLTILGLPMRAFAVRGLRKVHELLALIGNVGAIRRSWFDLQGRQELRRILELCHASLPEFSESRVIGVGVIEVQGYSNLLEIGSTILMPHGKSSVLALRDHIDRVLTSLLDLGANLAETQECLSKVLSVLGLAKRPLIVRSLGNVVELLNRLITVGSLRRSWLDPQQRREIRRVLDRCRDEEAVIAEVRFKLLETLLPIAFSPEGAILASRSRSYGPFQKFCNTALDIVSGGKRQMPRSWTGRFILLLKFVFGRYGPSSIRACL